MTRITTVIFDIFNTLLHIQTDERMGYAHEFLSTWLSYQGIQIEPYELYEAYQHYTKVELQKSSSEYPDIDVGDVFDAILADAGLAASVKKAGLICEVALIFRLLTTCSLSLYPEIPHMLCQLQGSGRVRLAIASNTQRLFSVPELRKFGLEKFFECSMFSSDVKACKPDAKLFNAVLDQLNIQPQEAIYVGDNLFEDVWGAQKVGMQTIRIERAVPYLYPPAWQMTAADRTIPGSEVQHLPELIFSMQG